MSKFQEMMDIIDLVMEDILNDIQPIKEKLNELDGNDCTVIKEYSNDWRSSRSISKEILFKHVSPVIENKRELILDNLNQINTSFVRLFNLIAKINFSDLGDDEKSYLLVYTTMSIDKIFRENLKKITH